MTLNDLKTLLSLPHYLVDVGVYAGVCHEIPKRYAAQLVIIIPIEEELIDILLSALVFAHLRVVEVESGYLADHESLHIGVVAPLRYGVGPQRDVELLLLVVEALAEYEDILVKLHLLLAQAALHHIAVALAHLHFAAALAPVEYRYLESYFHYLIVFQWVVGIAYAVGCARIAHLSEERYLALLSLGLGHGIVGLKLAAADILGETVVGMRLFEHIGIAHSHIGNRLGNHRVEHHILFHIEKRLKLEHRRAIVALTVGVLRAGVEQVEFELQKVVLAYLSSSV